MPAGTSSEEARIWKQLSAPAQGTRGGGETVSLAATVSVADQERPWPVHLKMSILMAPKVSVETVASARGKESEPRCSVR